MKCNCGFNGNKDDFFTLEVVLSGYGSVVARKPKSGGPSNLGSVDLYACPRCGAIYCNAIDKLNDRTI